jgi:hypothetical protein
LWLENELCGNATKVFIQNAREVKIMDFKLSDFCSGYDLLGIVVVY